MRRDLATAVTVVVSVAALASAPAIAESVADYARNSGKVDGIDAVRAGARPQRRAGKLVATNALGYLPADVVGTVPNARRVGRMLPSEIVRASARSSSGHLGDFHSRGFARVHGARVVAPRAGILLLWGQLSVEWDEDSEPGSYATLVATFAVDDDRVGTSQVVELDRSTRRGTEAISLEAAVPVDRGPHRISIQLRRASGRALAYVRPRHTQTLFVPFGNEGRRGVL